MYALSTPPLPTTNSHHLLLQHWRCVPRTGAPIPARTRSSSSWVLSLPGSLSCSMDDLGALVTHARVRKAGRSFHNPSARWLPVACTRSTESTRAPTAIFCSAMIRLIACCIQRRGGRDRRREGFASWPTRYNFLDFICSASNGKAQRLHLLRPGGRKGVLRRASPASSCSSTPCPPVN